MKSVIKKICVAKTKLIYFFSEVYIIMSYRAPKTY